MDAVEVLKIEKRMCDTFEFCYGCPIRVLKEREDMSCREFMGAYPEEYISVVEKWAEEHPVKTKKQKFLELFNADTPRKWHKDCEKTCNANVPCSFDCSIDLKK